jgi:hypothetical protein
MIQIEDRGFKTVFELLSEDKMSEALSELIRTSTQNVKDFVKDVIPVKTGRLRDSVRSEVLSTHDCQVIVGNANAHYAFFVFHGTRPHVIEPNNAKALRFEVNGHIIFARKVFHPGTEPIPLWMYLVESMHVTLPKFAQEVLDRTLSASQKGE